MTKFHTGEVRKMPRLWPLVAVLCVTPLAEAAQQRTGYSGYQCVLMNGNKLFSVQDISQIFPQSVLRCLRVRVATVLSGVEGKEPRSFQDYPLVSDAVTVASQAQPLPLDTAQAEAPAKAEAPAPALEPAPDMPTAQTPLLARKLVERAKTKGKEFYKLIVEACWRHELDPALVQAVIHVESAYQPHARSRTGALGLMQVMPATGARYGVSEPKQLLDPALNIEVGTHYLRDLHTMFKGNTELILAAYNAGEGAVARYGNRIPPYPETRDYVRRTLSIYRGHQR